MRKMAPNQLYHVFRIYHIDVHSALLYPWEKDMWKVHVDRQVRLYWHSRMVSMAVKKCTMHQIPLECLEPGRAHVIWMSCLPDIFQVKATMVQAKLLTCIYPLQARRAKFNKQEADPTCVMCKEAKEDTIHFLIQCLAPASTRKPNILRLQQFLKKEDLPMPT